jgi:histidinol-phosphate aminotransferase
LLAFEEKKSEWVKVLLRERERMIRELSGLPFVIKIYPSDANFLLVKTQDPKAIYQHLRKKKIIVRDRSGIRLCAGCLRISIGTPEENITLINALKGLI